MMTKKEALKMSTHSYPTRFAVRLDFQKLYAASLKRLRLRSPYTPTTNPSFVPLDARHADRGPPRGFPHSRERLHAGTFPARDGPRRRLAARSIVHPGPARSVAGTTRVVVVGRWLFMVGCWSKKPARRSRRC